MTYAEPEIVSFEEAKERGVGQLFGGVAPGRMLRVSMGDENYLVVMADQDLASIEEAVGDLFDSLVAVTRMANDTGQRTSLAEAIELFGITEEELAAIDE